MKKWLTIGFSLIVCLAHSQNEDIDLESFAERLFQVQDENIAYEDVYESLLLYYSHKLNLNKAEPEELASLYILNPAQLSGFFSYRDQFGELLSIHELQAIPEIDLETINQLRPFVTVSETVADNRTLFKRIITEENNYLLLRYSRRLEQQQGYTPAWPLDTTFVKDESGTITDTLTAAPSRYLGSPDKMYGRFRTSRRGDFSLGFTFEKDAGESLGFSEGKPGFDFYSYHLMLENKWGFDQILLGDFQLQIGQGVLSGAGFNAGKGAETVNTTKRNNLGMLPYTSVLESGYFRGVGVSRSFSNFKVTLFYSRLMQDGNIQSDSTYSAYDEFVNSIQVTGFHRTPSELASKDRIVEQSMGVTVEYRPHHRFAIGMAGLTSHFSQPLQRKPNNYNQFEFKGHENRIVSTYGHYTWQNFTFFGEAAHSQSGGVGAVGGLMASLSTKVDIAMVFRNYDRDFHSFYGNAFAENSRIINERGTYWGLTIRPIRRHTLNLYYDRFKFPWLKYQTEAPSFGHEWLARHTYAPSRQVNLYAQLRQQTRQVTIANENLNQLVDQVRHNYLFNMAYEVSPQLKLKTKVQGSTQKEGSAHTRGFAILQDVNFSWWELDFHTRMALFETDDFDNAQYVYENDVLYAFSIPAYNGKGVRTYFMVRYDPFSNVSLWLRYARFAFRDRDTLGSGLEESSGSTSTELKAMLRIKF